MSDNVQTPAAASTPAPGAGDLGRIVWRALWNPSGQGKPPGEAPLHRAVMNAARAGQQSWRSTTVIKPDGTREKIIIDSPAERMKTWYLGMKMAALVVGILFAGSICRFIGEQMAGHSGAVAQGFFGYWLRQVGL